MDQTAHRSPTTLSTSLKYCLALSHVTHGRSAGTSARSCLSIRGVFNASLLRQPSILRTVRSILIQRIAFFWRGHSVGSYLVSLSKSKDFLTYSTLTCSSVETRDGPMLREKDRQATGNQEFPQSPRQADRLTANPPF